jgi:ABC-type uncharacterized transport system substrate-binding protein
MRRREFIAGLGSAATWPLAAHAQQRAAPVVGFLTGATETDEGPSALIAAARQGLGETGFVAGRNVQILYRWAEKQFDRLPALAEDLVRRRVDAIFAADTTAAVAAKSATSTIPIVFFTGADPVALGLVASLNRPGGNLTGVGFLEVQIIAKRLELLHEIVPAVTRIGFLVNPTSPRIGALTKEVETGAGTLGVQLVILNASSASEIDASFAEFAGKRTGALLIDDETLFLAQRDQLISLAARYSVPAIYGYREFAVAGGLMSYGPSIGDAFRLAGNYVGRILKGEKPADLPVQQPARFEMVLNLKTSKALGIEVPTITLLRATEVIQ